MTKEPPPLIDFQFFSSTHWMELGDVLENCKSHIKSDKL